MSRLGKRQLAELAALAGVHMAVIVPDAVDRSLIARGLMTSLGKKSASFAALTPAGYRAVADAMESGAITRRPLSEWRRPEGAAP